MNNTNNAATPAVVKQHERNEAVNRPDKNWKPYPCLLTRKELEKLVAEQLG